MAKLIPKYVGPYEILEKERTNTYSLVDQDGDVEDLVHAGHLKPYFAEKEPENDNETSDDEKDDARPPREDEATAMSDPPQVVYLPKKLAKS